jgi:hypothetical protein
MPYKDYKNRKVPDAAVKSHAEALAAMDCLLHHLNDEEAIEPWLANGVPDSDSWCLLGTSGDGPDAVAGRRRYYEDLVRDMTIGEFEEMAELFARLIKGQCFRVEYTPRAFI